MSTPANEGTTWRRSRPERWRGVKSFPGGKDDWFCGLRRKQRRRGGDRSNSWPTSHSVNTLVAAGRKAGEDFLPLPLLKVATLFFLSFLLFFAYQCFPEERRNDHKIIIIFFLPSQIQFTVSPSTSSSRTAAATLLLPTPVRYGFLQGLSLLLEASPCRGAQTQIGQRGLLQGCASFLTGGKWNLTGEEKTSWDMKENICFDGPWTSTKARQQNYFDASRYLMRQLKW